MGGGYTPENTINVEVSQCNKNTATHPMWHFANWQLWGKEEDRLAWRGLTGYLGKGELIRESCSLSGKKTGPLTSPKNFGENRNHPNVQKARSENGNRTVSVMNSHPNTLENQKRQGEANAAAMNDHENTRKSKSANGRATGPANGKSNAPAMNSHPNTLESQKANAKNTNSQRWQCLVTGHISSPGNLSRYQMNRGIDTSLRVKLSIVIQKED
jgi:hypothetical protein